MKRAQIIFCNDIPLFVVIGSTEDGKKKCKVVQEWYKKIGKAKENDVWEIRDTDFTISPKRKGEKL